MLTDKCAGVVDDTVGGGSSEIRAWGVHGWATGGFNNASSVKHVYAGAAGPVAG
jgi:hypothetical protein